AANGISDVAGIGIGSVTHQVAQSAVTAAVHAAGMGRPTCAESAKATAASRGPARRETVRIAPRLPLGGPSHFGASWRGRTRCLAHFGASWWRGPRCERWGLASARPGAGRRVVSPGGSLRRVLAQGAAL